MSRSRPSREPVAVPTERPGLRFIARRPLKLADRIVPPGGEVPEAALFPSLATYIELGLLEVVAVSDGGEAVPLPQAAALAAAGDLERHRPDPTACPTCGDDLGTSQALYLHRLRAHQPQGAARNQ